MPHPRELTIVSAIQLMRTGYLTAQELVESCLERIHEREGTIHAWVELYEREALEEARRCDEESRKGQWRGELHGIPIGIKDIIHVKGMVTRAGSAIYPAHVAVDDAPAVQLLRSAGAIILGKTETTPFADADPTITRNPRNPEYSPGGSSSGSAASVADWMCFAALGTQTGGSVLRPAAFCGAVGFKPTYGRVSTEGVIPNSYTIDTVGILARSATDAWAVFRNMIDEDPLPFGRMPRPLVPGRKDSDSPPHLGCIKDIFEEDVSPEVGQNFTFVLERLERKGAVRADMPLPESFSHVPSWWEIIKVTEQACWHRTLFDSHRDEYPPKIKARIEKGIRTPGYHYVEALHKRIAFQQEMSGVLSKVNAAIMPTSSTIAPKGLSSTGSPAFNRPWSFCGFPAITIPSGTDNKGLPFAIQLVAQPMAEESLIKVASWCERALDFNSNPP